MPGSARRAAWVTAVLAAAVLVPAVPAVAAIAPGPHITSVTFSGVAGTGRPSPTITVTGGAFGTAPVGVDDDVTACGPYTANGESFHHDLQFSDDNRFVAGIGGPRVGSRACVGIVIVSWTDTQVVLQFGNSYGTFTNWFLRNHDGYALSIKKGIFGGTVKGLT